MTGYKQFRYSFSPVDCIPSSRYFCPKRNTNTGGSIIISDAAIAKPSCSLTICGKYSDSGQLIGFLRNVMGCSIMLQHSMNPSTSAASIPGIPSGSPIFMNVLKCPAPSIAAASRTPRGTELNPCTMINTGNAENVNGSMIAHSVSISPSWSITM